MKKTALLVTCTALLLIHQTDAIKGTVSVNVELCNNDNLMPSEWYEYFYSQLPTRADKREISHMLDDLGTYAMQSLIVIEQQEKELLTGGDLYTIANTIFQATQFQGSVPDQNNAPLMATLFALLKTVMVIPEGFKEMRMETVDAYHCNANH